MNHFKRYFTVLVFLMLVFALPAWVQGVTLDTSGTDTCSPGYVCNGGAFQFKGTDWYKPGKVFFIDFTHQCSGVCLQQYMPGWGGGGVNFQIVTIHGEYDYDTGSTHEQIKHQGKIIIEETLKCAKNPWAYGCVAAGCGQATVVNKVTINGKSVSLDPPYPLSVRYMSGDLLMAIQNWDIHKDDPDPLADWDPYGTPDGYSALKITSPASNASIGEHAASFTLALQNLPSVPPGGLAKKVLMRWQRAQEVPEWQGDIHIQPGTYDWFPFTGPPDAWSTQFPLTVAVEPGYFAGKPGHYRVQVKLANETWWSPWAFFWIGQPTFNVKKLSQNTTMASLKKNMMTAKMQGTMKSKGTKGQVASSTKMTKQVTLKQAVVVVESLGYKPAPTKPGDQVDLIITFKNKGLVASSADLKYSVSCTVKSGGPACAVASTTRPINKAIPGGQTHSITLAGATPAKAGTYEVTVKPEGVAVDSGKTITIEVKIKLKPTKGVITPTKRQ